MREVVLFCEDYAHEIIIGTLIARLAQEEGVDIQLDWRNTRGGFGKVKQEFREFTNDLKNHGENLPDLIVVATDSNCKGPTERGKEFIAPDFLAGTVPLTLALPNPHIERWLLLDGEAFMRVCGKGCSAPDQKCNRNRYKKLLREAVLSACLQPTIGGLEWAKDIVRELNMERAQKSDEAFKRFTQELSRTFNSWQR